MQKVRLMNRVDTKYLISTAQMNSVFERIAPYYFLQVIDDKRLAHYQTIYYDTPQIDMYMNHHAGKLNRMKIRMRSYLDSNLSFCEIKRKNNKGRTKKKRVEIPYDDMMNAASDHDVATFLAENQPFEVSSLSPNLETLFDRITLVDQNLTERLTIDLNLSFRNFVSGSTAVMPDLAVVELKQSGMASSVFKDVLFDMRIKPFKMSKYCIGTCMTRPDVKQNHFKKKLRHIAKMEQEIFENKQQ